MRRQPTTLELERYLTGDLPDDEAVALRARADAEPGVRRRLDELA